MSPTLWDSCIGALSCVGSVRADWAHVPSAETPTDETTFALDGEDVDAMEALASFAAVLTDSATI